MDCGHGGQEVVLWREAALQGGHAVIALQDGEQVVAEWVRDVLGEVGVWALTSHVRLDSESQHANHGETAVLDLLNLQLSEHLWVISQVQGVKGATRVQLVQAIEDVGVELANTWGKASGASSVHPELLHSAQQNNLNQGHGSQGQGVLHHAEGHGKVVQGATVEHLSASLEPCATLDVSTVGLQALWDEDTSSSKHGPAGVQQLIGTVLLHLLFVLAQAQRIVAVVAGQLAVQVLGHIIAVQQTSGQEELTLRTVPLLQVRGVADLPGGSALGGGSLLGGSGLSGGSGLGGSGALQLLEQAAHCV
mmetsp:Transcript_28578/g.77100  ORF Transcript_28578/g.77100 Transcript_28578/m.77100 type:complete len:306 (-) Transcript_28578:58-975(-)